LDLFFPLLEITFLASLKGRVELKIRDQSSQATEAF